MHAHPGQHIDRAIVHTHVYSCARLALMAWAMVGITDTEFALLYFKKKVPCSTHREQLWTTSVFTLLLFQPLLPHTQRALCLTLPLLALQPVAMAFPIAAYWYIGIRVRRAPIHPLESVLCSKHAHAHPWPALASFCGSAEVKLRSRGACSRRPTNTHMQESSPACCNPVIAIQCDLLLPHTARSWNPLHRVGNAHPRRT